jgi:hypothetical protein
VIEIRSYRRVFDLERRIYRLDRWRLNPGGLPVRGIVYLLAVLAALAILLRLPLVGTALGRLPWYLLDFALPLLVSMLLALVHLEGRPFHVAALALLRFRARSPRRYEFRALPARSARWHPDRIVVLPDGGDARVRALRFDGPGAAVVAVPHEIVARADGVRARVPGRRRRRDELLLIGAAEPETLARRKVIWLGAGARLRTRASREQDRVG